MVVRTLLFSIFLLAVQQLQAQICNGSLGDPIVNITFGAGPNPGAALSAATTSYQYISTDCPQDGFYALRSSSVACHGNTWHTITDHTGNANGYFMLINASMQPSAFYLDTVRGLCGNTTYEFAAWIVNVLKSTACGGAGIQPDLTFRIERTDGTVLQSYNTNKIPQTNNPEWKQFGFYFKTPMSVSDVVLRIINNSQGGCGNDLALDDITFRACGPQISAAFLGQTGSSVSVCEGTPSTHTFTGNVSVGFNNPVLQWQQNFNGGAWSDIPGETFTQYIKSFPSNTAAGNYAFRLAAAEAGNLGTTQCRVASLPLTVTVQANGLPAATSNGPACEGNSFTLSAMGATLSWTGPNGFVASGNNVVVNNATLQMSGTYYVQAVNGSCFRTDSTRVTVNPKPSISASVDTINICQGDTAVVYVMGANSFSWTPSASILQGNAATLVFPRDSIVYRVVGTSLNGCRDTLELVANVYSKPTADAGPDLSLVEGNAVRLKGRAGGDSTRHFWTPDLFISSPDTLQPLVNPVDHMFYQLNVVSLLGCGTAIDTMRVHVYQKIEAPNAFSPNGDGINDRWNIGGLHSYFEAEVLVFDRFGRQVFQSRDFNGWDGTTNGKALPVGTYYYLLRLGAPFTAVTGWLLLLR